jgi:alanine-synthesizing transaminase
MEFRRINGLPPYVFATINDLKAVSRRAGNDVIDLGFGNPDLPSPDVAVEKLSEAAHNSRNHRYSASRGIPKLRSAITDLYARKFNVELDPETEVVTTIGAKEGFSHLMWVLVGPGDTALVPSPSYPIHIWGPLFAGADVRQVPLNGPAAAVDGMSPPDPGDEFFDGLMHAWEESWPKPRVIVLSFPHNPTTACVDLSFMERLVNFAREHEVILVHDFAYADLGFDGYEPPSILQVPGAKDVAVELYTMTKSFSMAGWRVGFVLGNAEIVQALTKLKTYLDYGTFQPIQIAAIVAMNEAPNYPKELNVIYKSRRDALCDGLNKIGWNLVPPKGTMFVWAPIPEPYKEMGSLEFSKLLIQEADVATSPGVGFGPGGDGHVRFALIENEQRIHQAVRNLRGALTKLG